MRIGKKGFLRKYQQIDVGSSGEDSNTNSDVAVSVSKQSTVGSVRP